MTLNVISARGAQICFKLTPDDRWSAMRLRETSSLVPVEYHEGYTTAKEKISVGVQNPGRPTAAFVAANMAVPLESTKVSNSVSPGKSRGQGGITKIQRATIRNGCALLEKEWRKELLALLTLTVPPVFGEPSGDQYAHACHIFYKAFSRYAIAAGLDERWVSCTEIQEKRLANHGQFALHEHIAFHARLPGKTWGIHINDLREAWARALGTATGRDYTEQDIKVCADIKPIKKSVKSYLGKYMSKGTKVVKDLIDRGYVAQIPHTWVHRSLAMVRSIRKNTVRLYGAAAELIAETLIKGGFNYSSWFTPVKVQGKGGNEIEMGMCGQLVSGTELMSAIRGCPD